MNPTDLSDEAFARRGAGSVATEYFTGGLRQSAEQLLRVCFDFGSDRESEN